MDDIILGSLEASDLRELTATCLSILQESGFTVAPDKIQIIPPFKIWGSILSLDSLSPAKPQLSLWESYSLPQFQKLLGEINWMSPWIPVTTKEMVPLFDLLKGLVLIRG